MSGLSRLVSHGDLRGWQGLGDLSLSDVTAVFPRDSDWVGTARLGRLQEDAAYVWALVPGSDQRLRIWYRAGRVILLDRACGGAFPVRPDRLGGLLADVPVALDAWLGTLPMPGSELVFAARGFTAFVNRETRSVWHMALFRRQSLDEYVDTVRIDMRSRRLPPSHG